MRVLSYNMHKGFNYLNRNFVLWSIKDAIKLVGADLVFLQEVLGKHSRYEIKHPDWPLTSQFEFLADTIWQHYAYGQNAAYTDGHHGNALLSHYPIDSWENIDISTNAFESRGMLHAVLKKPEVKTDLHCICLHLDLLESGRSQQIEKIIDRIKVAVPNDSPLIVAGDFNDWKGTASQSLYEELNLKEVSMEMKGEHAKTFPSWLPLLRLDRIHYRGLKLKSVEVLKGKPWSRLSDHSALLAEFEGDLD